MNPTNSISTTTNLDLEQLAAALSRQGYAVQLLDGGTASGTGAEDDSSNGKRAAAAGRALPLLQRLQHQFLLCTGTLPAWSADAPSSACVGDTAAPSATNATDSACTAVSTNSAAHLPTTTTIIGGGGTESVLLADPLIIDPRFREQFVIHFGGCVPTSYEYLLMAVPHMFVGTLARLKVIVTLLAGEVSAVFRQHKRPLPPWRTCPAMLSRWSPEIIRDYVRAAATAAALADNQQQHVEAAMRGHVRGGGGGGGSRRNSSSSSSSSGDACDGVCDRGQDGGRGWESGSYEDSLVAAAAAALLEPGRYAAKAGAGTGSTAQDSAAAAAFTTARAAIARGFDIGSPDAAAGRHRHCHGASNFAHGVATAATAALSRCVFDDGSTLVVQRIASVGVLPRARERRREGALAAALRASSCAASGGSSGAGSSPARMPYLAPVSAPAFANPHGRGNGINATSAASAPRAAFAPAVSGATAALAAAAAAAAAVAPCATAAAGGVAPNAPEMEVGAAAGQLLERRQCNGLVEGWAFHFHKVRLGGARARQ